MNTVSDVLDEFRAHTVKAPLAAKDHAALLLRALEGSAGGRVGPEAALKMLVPVVNKLVVAALQPVAEAEAPQTLASKVERQVVQTAQSDAAGGAAMLADGSGPDMCVELTMGGLLFLPGAWCRSIRRRGCMRERPLA